MHLTEAEIRTFVDNELPAQQRQAAQEHLAGCPTCRETAQALLERGRFVQQRLAALPNPTGVPATSQARQRLNLRLAQTEPIPFKEKLSMLKQSFSRLSRPALAAITLAVVLAVALAFPSVRAMASDFLGLFRVQQVQVIPVDMEQMPGQMASSNSLEALFKNNVAIEGGDEALPAADAAAAGQMSGIDVRLPSVLHNPALYVQKGGSLALTVNVKLMNEVLKDMGHADLQIPSDLDGSKIKVTVPNSVMAMYGDCPKPTEEEAQAAAEQPDGNLPDCVAFMQMPSPEVEAPADLDVQRLGQIYLELLGMEPEKAANFAQTIDWTSTFVLPMPSNFANYQTLSVDGVDATFIRTHNEGQRGYMLLWLKNGMLYCLTGPGGGDAALEIANSIQ